MYVDRCVKHPFERAETFCRGCGNGYCEGCLVRPAGGHGPYCVECAMAAAGIRPSAGAPPACSRKEIRRMEREERKLRRLAERGAPPPTAAPVPQAATADSGVIPAPRRDQVPPPAKTSRRRA